MKKQIYFNKEKHAAFTQSIRAVTDLIEAAQTELRIQGIKDEKLISLEALQDGRFVSVFEKFHKSEQAKSDLTKGMIHSKYLELYGRTDKKLLALEESYNSIITKEYRFYDENNDFYNYCEKEIERRNTTLEPYLKNAPKKKTYRFTDFATIKGNNVKIDVPEAFFIVYLNQKQLDTMSNILAFLELSKRLGIERKHINHPLQKYLLTDNSHWAAPQKGLEADLTPNWDYNKLILIK